MTTEARGGGEAGRAGRAGGAGGVRTPVRVGAVGYLNARPLTWALDRQPDPWQVR